MKQIDKETGNIIEIFRAIRDAYRKLNRKYDTHIGDVCKGKYGCKSAFGYRWEWA